MALLFGAAFWTLMLSLPYVWPVIVAGLMIASLGLTLTARYRVTWKREQQA
jgi:predicted benzoate:H+ symporter BenE